MKSSWGINFLRDIGFNIFDKGVYGILDLVYKLFNDLSKMTILSQQTIAVFASRLYAIIAVFMLFKATFSLLSLFVDPDKLNDSKVGAGSIIKRIIISLVMIVIIPTIFSMAYEIQSLVISENIIGNVILGINVKTRTESIQKTQELAGKRMAVAVFSGFFKPYEGVTWSGNNKATYDLARSEANFNRFSSLVTETDASGRYVMDYSVFFSTVAGGFTAWIIMLFCIDLAVRSVKLAFLQLIAPIPILSYVDPKSGDGIFKKWISTCTSTYLDVFMRLTIIYFVIFIISELTSGAGIISVYDYSGKKIDNVGLFAGAFIIIGLLMFAKEAPKLITDILGIKVGDGKFSLNPLKKVTEGLPGFAKSGASMIGAGAMGAIATPLAKYNANKQLGGSTAESLRKAAGGVLGGAYRAGKEGLKSGGKGNVIAMGQKAGAQAGQRTYAEYGTNKKGRAIARASNLFGLDTPFSKLDKKSKALDTYAKYKDDIQAATQENTGVRNAKKDLDDAIAGGNMSDITNNRLVYEQARDKYINEVNSDVNLKATTQVGAILKKTDDFYEENASVLTYTAVATDKDGKIVGTKTQPIDKYTTTKCNAEGKNGYGATAANAKAESVKVQNSAEYETAKRTDAAVKPSK